MRLVGLVGGVAQRSDLIPKHCLAAGDSVQDRNRHALLHHLDHVLQPAAQTGGKRNGWVMLVANGGGGFWYEVTPDFRDALQTTLPSLQQLAEDLENDPDGMQVAPTLQRVEALHEQATQAWERFAKVKVGRRG